jgi:DNA (cytosine-5)-methyltransferase 1
LENVDRLLKSPANQRGRDFAIMLASLSDLGYIVEWRIINAADYGMPQRRRRIYILAYKKGIPLTKHIDNSIEWITESGTLSRAFPAKGKRNNFTLPFQLIGDLVEVSNNFNRHKANISPFEKCGIMIDRQVWTLDVEPIYDDKRVLLCDILEGDESKISEEFYIDEKDLPRWEYLKGAKNEPRKNSNGDIFYYTEGALPFPDPLDRPARTIITSEGGKTPSRFKHVIQVDGRFRRLTPVELERADMFPDNHTIGVPDARRAFLMGNALVVGVVEKIGQNLINHIN